MTNTSQLMLKVHPFKVDIAQDLVDDMQDRLARTRYATEAPGDDWNYGTPVSYLREMVEYWRTEFDWRAAEARMNELPQYITDIDGQTVHFVHIRSAVKDATPLLLVHAFPGSFFDFIDAIEALVDPEAHGGRKEDAFHVVVPCVPGFGFSTPLADGRWTIARAAGVLDKLMRGLGYESYGSHGSDLGAMISRELAAAATPGFLGAHVLQLFSFPSGDPTEFAAMTPADYESLEFAGWYQTVDGYAQMNAKRPQTIAAALSDSPVGQLAYSELLAAFGNGTSLVSRDQVLTQVSLYWLTNTSGTSVRMYHDDRDAEPKVNNGEIGVTVFASDFRSMRPFAERDNTQIVSWTEQPSGGHYASLEVPDQLVQEIRAFFGRDR
jgi:epoxide hydrolase